jgi:hypothetical protein
MPATRSGYVALDDRPLATGVVMLKESQPGVFRPADGGNLDNCQCGEPF